MMVVMYVIIGYYYCRSIKMEETASILLKEFYAIAESDFNMF